MDTLAMLGGVVLGAALILLVPGPTNTLLLTAGYLQGIRRAFPLVVAEMAGYGLAISAWGFCLFALALRYPLVMSVAKLGCALFIAALAYGMWRRPLLSSDPTATPITFRGLFTATLLNPKALLFATAVFPREVYDLPALYGYAMAAFWLTIAPIGLAWIWLGQCVERSATPRLQRQLPRLVGLALSLFSAWLAYSALT